MQKKMNQPDNATGLVDLIEIQQELLSGGADREDLATLQRLTEEFATALATSSAIALPSFLNQSKK